MKSMTKSIKDFMKENFNRWNNIKICPYCNKGYKEKTKYMKSCARCGHTIKYSPDHMGSYKLLNEYKRLK